MWFTLEWIYSLRDIFSCLVSKRNDRLTGNVRLRVYARQSGVCMCIYGFMYDGLVCIGGLVIV